MATSQPSASFIGIATASARMPPGSGTLGCSCHPTDGPPIDSRRVASASLPSGCAPLPAAHTTTCPADQEACNCTSPGSHGSDVIGRSSSRYAVAFAGDGGGTGGGRNRAAVARSPSSVSVKSATTWSRSSPVRFRTDARSSSASMIKRSSIISEERSSARNSASSSSDPRPSEIDQIAASSCCESRVKCWSCAGSAVWHRRLRACPVP